MAIRYPVNTTFAIAWPLRVFYIVFKPIIYLMDGFANFFVNMIGFRPLGGGEVHSEEELKMIISESQEGGAIEETERDLIRNIFEVSDRRVSHVQHRCKNANV